MRAWLIALGITVLSTPALSAVRATCMCEFRHENKKVQCIGEAESGFKFTASINAKRNGFNEIFKGREKEYTIVHVHLFGCQYEFFY